MHVQNPLGPPLKKPVLLVCLSAAHDSPVQGLHVGKEGWHALLQESLDIGLSCLLKGCTFLHVSAPNHHWLVFALYTNCSRAPMGLLSKLNPNELSSKLAEKVTVGTEVHAF